MTPEAHNYGIRQSLLLGDRAVCDRSWSAVLLAQQYSSATEDLFLVSELAYPALLPATGTMSIVAELEMPVLTPETCCLLRYCTAGRGWLAPALLCGL